jgi:hypothetical protein
MSVVNIFNSLENYKIGNQNRQRSSAKTKKNEPIVEIYKEGDTLYLKFVRSSDEFKLENTMKQFLCYAVKIGVKNVELEDDALFSDKDDVNCKYNALFYRALKGSPGIYAKYGFVPTVNVADFLEIIKGYTRGQANEELTKFIDKVTELDGKRELFSKILEVEEDKKNDLFGEYVTKLECNTMREVIMILQNLGRKIKNDNKNNAFLESLRKYYEAHRKLTREPTCEGKGGGMVRHRARSSSRTKKYRRSTRTNRHNYKRTSKKRSNY